MTTNTVATKFSDHPVLVAAHQRAWEGLRHFELPEFTALADDLATVGDLSVARAYEIISPLVRRTQEAARANRRAPAYCGVCRDVADLCAAVLDVLKDEPESSLAEAGPTS